MTDAEFMAKWHKALPAVRRSIVKAGVPFADVDDLVQNAFIKAWSDNETRQLSMRDGFRARCRTIAFNAAIDHQRKFGRELAHDAIEAPAPTDIEHEVEQREKARFVNDVVRAELPDKQREAVLNRDAMSEDPKVRKSQIASLARARKMLGDRIKDFGVVAPFLVDARRRLGQAARRSGPVGAAAGAMAAIAAFVALLPDPPVANSTAPEVVHAEGPAVQFPARAPDELMPPGPHTPAQRGQSPSLSDLPIEGPGLGIAPSPPAPRRVDLHPEVDRPGLLALCGGLSGGDEQCLELPLGPHIETLIQRGLRLRLQIL